MRIEPFVRLVDQMLLESSFTNSRFVVRDKQDGLSLGGNGQRHPLGSTSGSEAKLLQIGMPRPVQGAHLQLAEPGSQCLKELRPFHQLVLHVTWQGIEFRVEGRIESDFPVHSPYMI